MRSIFYNLKLKFWYILANIVACTVHQCNHLLFLYAILCTPNRWGHLDKLVLNLCNSYFRIL